MLSRKSEAYDDPLRKRSQAVSIGKVNLPSKLATHDKERFVTMQDESQIEWSNLIFLPFHPVFRMFVLVSVFIKAMLGPIQSVYPIVYCNDVMDYNPSLIFIKYCYWYFCDSLYGMDTFLHIVHRQVVDKAMRREHLPKSALLLMFDLISLVPFFRLLEENPCPPPQIWPNILAFNEFVVIYRVMQYFELVSSHSYFKLLIGFGLVMAMCINCVTCFWLLLTHEGFCENCLTNETYYDWRAFVMFKLNETDEEYSTFIYGAIFVYGFVINQNIDAIMPSAVAEYIMICIFMVAGYTLGNFVVIPKAFAESMLRFRRVCAKYPAIKKIIDETKRRNPLDDSYKKVKKHYVLLWRKRSCIIAETNFLMDLPRYLRLEIKQDLLWPLYYHSPILRKTSYPFRRWLGEAVIITYKLPGEKLYIDKTSGGTLYYLKSGIIQLISVDDGATPILSVTAGTIFGDINFLLPNMKRKVQVRCLTYCEMFYLERKYFITALHKYPSDRKIVLEDANERIKHAKCLFENKQHIRGYDRNVDEGIAWIKSRWWEISNALESFTKKTGEPKECLKGNLPREDTIYHCAKYIGQLVLCTKTQLQTNSMFTNYKFPWILNPHSRFGYEWHRIVTVTVMLVLFLHPQNLIKADIPGWFQFFSHASDSIYAIDIGVSLFTAVGKQETVTATFSSVMFERFKSFTFMLDIMSTVWIEDLAELVGAPEYYYTLQFNRLLKVYMLFYGDYLNADIRKDPIVDVTRKIALLHFAFTLISSHVVFEMLYYMPKLTMEYYFGEILCSRANLDGCHPLDSLAGCAVSWSFEWTYSENRPQTLADIYVAVVLCFLAYIIHIFCKGRFISYLYLQNRNTIKYQCFVVSLKGYYQHYRIHQDLLKRLDRYLICHWKYYKGTDVMYPNTLENEPFGVFWKAQGNVARKTIQESKAFKNADPELIRELACAGKFLILPRNASILMFGIQCKNVTWVVQGYIKSEYYDEAGQQLTTYFGYGSMLSASAVFLGRASLRAYTAYTECEILYIPIKDFFDIYKKYPIEYSYLKSCKKEFGKMFDEIFRKYVMKHRDYQHKLRDRIYSTRMSMVSTSKVIADIQDTRSLPVEGLFWGDPESGFMQSWMLFRVIIVCVSITSASMLGGIGAVSQWVFMMISAFCDCIAWVDIVVKVCLPFYNDQGLYVTNKRKCLMNYLTKGFVLDIIGAAPWFSVLKALLYREIDDDTCFLINTFCKFAHMYIVFAYFDYITDIPTVNITSIMIIKWQIVNILIVMGSSHYLMVNCVSYSFNSAKDLIDVSRRNECWMPTLFRLPDKLNRDQLHLIFAESLNLAESGMMRMNFGRFVINRDHLGVGFILFILGLTFWFISCYTLTLLVLRGRGDTVFQHGVNQLKRFLTSERVEKDVIDKVMDHFRYCWLRTEGINIQQLTNERIGLVFRQDLSYYFYKKTFTILDSILVGGETMQRHLASASDVAYFLPDHEIFREMDLVSNICIVHRGRVNVYKNGKKIIILTKGDIFGPLNTNKVRPIHITAIADDHVDVLNIEITAFHSLISEEVKNRIARSRQAKNDFMATTNIFIENPYDTVRYLLRGRKTIMLPWNKEPVEARHRSWYSRWLSLAWLVGPFITSAITPLFVILPGDSVLWFRFYCVLYILDVIHLANFITEFYTIELVVEKKKCCHKRFGVKKFKYWGLYLDACTLLIPLVTLVTNNWRYQLARIFRLKLFIDFEFHFCRSFKSNAAPNILKIMILLLLMHFFAIGWIIFACRDSKFPIYVPPTRHLNKTIDFSQWAPPDEERLGGCARTTRILDDNYGGNPAFVVPRHWPHDYVVAMTYILLIHTHTSLDTIIAVSLKQVYYKVFITFFVYLLDMWIMAQAINYAFTKYRELYQYDFRVNNMITYLSDIGICRSLKDTVLEYTHQVWKRQRGDWLPELAYQAPPCLRQDLFSALYIHHLEAAPTFRILPLFFKKQLTARFQRVVIFPGKCIVREGDVFNTTYFIHEGEVEKWFTDQSGESQLLSVLNTNGYFGTIAGLFTNTSFQFSFYSRTVVDLVYLNLDNWKDLLAGYPEIKALLYSATKQVKRECTRNQYGKTRSMSTASGTSIF